jgi:predicted dehydrogenase
MKTLGMGLVGPGFIGRHHIDAVRRLGDVDVIAIAGSNLTSASDKASDLKVGRAYGCYQDLIDDPEVHVVHNTTPNHLHFEVTMAALRSGKHVISDKPLALNREQARVLRDAALAAGVVHVVTFNYRGNALIQHARSLVADAELGPLTFTHGHYLQDWLADDGVYSWRSDPEKGGATSALGDIGSHWCDLAEHVTGARIVEVLAELTTVVPVRYASNASREAFSRGDKGNRQAVKMLSDDLASVLLRFDNGAKGCVTIGQVLPGHKNDLRLEVNGRTASLIWNQERQNELHIGRVAQAQSTVVRDPAVLAHQGRRSAQLPAGHQEGWSDAFANVIADAYQWIQDGGSNASKPPATATFEDGYRSHCIIDAMLASHEAGGNWRPVLP